MWLDLRKTSLLAQQLKSILCLTLKLHSRISRYTKNMGIDSQVCFHRGLFSSLSNHERAPQGLWRQWMALIRMCVMLNCSQRLSRSTLWIVTVCATYWTHTTAACVLMVALTPTFGFPPTLPPPLTPLQMPFVILQSLWKSCSKSSNASYVARRKSYRTLVNYSSYTVNLAWLKSCSTEPQQLESFKSAFLVLLNVPIRMVVAETVTITCHLQLIYNSPCIASIVLNHIVIVRRNSETDMKWPMIN